MKNEWYEKIINNNEKSPFEGGIQALVYMFLQEYFLPQKACALVVVDRAQKQSRFSTYSGIPDLAVVTDDFEYKNEKGDVLLSVEIKETDKELKNSYEQVLGHLATFGKAIYTNGREWIYYDFHTALRNNIDNSKKEALENFKENIIEVVKLKKEIANKKLRRRGLMAAITKKQKRGEFDISVQNKAISECENCIKKYEEQLLEPSAVVETWIKDNKWIEKYISKGNWGQVIKVMNGNIINKEEYVMLEEKIKSLVKELKTEAEERIENAQTEHKYIC